MPRADNPSVRLFNGFTINTIHHTSKNNIPINIVTTNSWWRQEGDRKALSWVNSRSLDSPQPQHSLSFSRGQCTQALAAHNLRLPVVFFPQRSGPDKHRRRWPRLTLGVIRAWWLAKPNYPICVLRCTIRCQHLCLSRTTLKFNYSIGANYKISS